MTEEDTVTITLSKTQADSIMAACELYSRVHMGQFDWIMHQFMTRGDTEFWRDSSQQEEVHRLMYAAREIIFPELGASSSRDYGIVGIHVPESAKISWDLYQSLRYALIQANRSATDTDIIYSRPFQTSVQPLPSVIIEKVKSKK